MGNPDPEWTFVIEHEEKIEAILFCAPAAQTVIFLRLQANEPPFGWYRYLMAFVARVAQNRNFPNFWVFWEQGIAAAPGIANLRKVSYLEDKEVWNHVMGSTAELEKRYGRIVRDQRRKQSVEWQSKR